MPQKSGITLYTKPGCVQCTASERALTNKNIDFNIVDISESEDALALVKDLGYLQAPVVVTPTEHWSGFRPDKILETAALLQAA